MEGDFGSNPLVERVYENTFRLEPHEDERFQRAKVKKVIDEVLEKELEGKQYSAEDASTWSKSICEQIKAKVKELNFPRYKIVVQCTVGEVKGQSVRVASRCLWDTSSDNWASSSYQNVSLFAAALVFGTYFE